MNAKIYTNMITNLGYKNSPEFILKYILPLMTVVVVLFLGSLFATAVFPIVVPYLILCIGTISIVAYPYIMFEKKKVNIEENLHLFITYAGTISTVEISRHLLFKKVAEKRSLGEISHIAEKLMYFATRWNLGYSSTCRELAKISPSKIFGDFLDRLALMLDYGEGMEIFLGDEQDAVMDDYSANYKKSLENIKMVQEIFVALTMAIGFMLAVSLMLPLLTGTSMELILLYAVMGIMVLDVGILVFVNNFIPSDKLCHRGRIIDQETLDLYKWVYICFPISVIILGILFFMGWFSFLVNIAIAIIPLFFVGLQAQIIENKIITKEKIYPSFIRAFGTAIEVKSGAVMAAIDSLQVHDFGPLNESLTSLNRRLKAGSEKIHSWEFFYASTGSNLISEFSNIFAESIFLGGGPQKISEIISKNFLRIISLRKLRQQLASSMRGALYGALVGFSAAGFVAAKITEMLGALFSDNVLSGGEDAGGIMADIVPTNISIDMTSIFMYIGIMIIVHASVSSIIIKVVDGGNVYSALFDMCIMIWLGLIISIVVPWSIDLLLPGFTNVAGGAAGLADGAPPI